MSPALAELTPDRQPGAARGRIRAGDIRGILASRDRREAQPIAPPEGPCLWHIGC